MLRRLPLALVLLSTIAVPATAQTAAEQRRFDQAQRRYDNETSIYNRERGYYQDALRRDGRQPSNYNDPRDNDPNYNDPRANDPRYNDPRYNNAPRGADPRYGDPQASDPNADTQYRTDYDAARDYRDEPNYQERRLSSNDKVYRGSDGRYYCKRSDGTTGLIVGAAAGGILGNVIDGGRNRVGGTLIGGALGALLGKSVDQNSSNNGDYRCR